MPGSSGFRQTVIRREVRHFSAACDRKAQAFPAAIFAAVKYGWPAKITRRTPRAGIRIHAVHPDCAWRSSSATCDAAGDYSSTANNAKLMSIVGP
jgi:hypothetical protein